MIRADALNMPNSSRRALGEVRTRFARMPLPVRLYVSGRIFAFPPPFLDSYILPTGVLASFGCGIGIMEAYLGLRYPSLRIDASDCDPRKISIANDVAPPNVMFRVCDVISDPFPAGLPAILFVDLLHHIPRESHDAVVAKSFSALQPGGRLIVKDLDTRPRWKQVWNWGQDMIRSRGEPPHVRSLEEWRCLMERHAFEVASFAIATWRPYAHVVLVGTKRT